MHFATLNFGSGRRRRARPAGGRRQRHGILRTLCVTAVVAALPWISARAEESPADAFAKKAYWDARGRYEKEPNTADSAWQFARACFDRAGCATNNAERAEIAAQGIAACQQALDRGSNSAALHYYLGMNLGQLAQTRGVGALKLVDQMAQEFTRARDLDEKLDYAGPDRNLGLLYRDTPPFISMGSRSKARRELQRAVDLAPDYPENHLNLIEAFLKWSDKNGIRREWKAMETVWPRARTNFTGSAWAASWAGWDKRFQQVKSQVETPPKALEAPRQQD